MNVTLCILVSEKSRKEFYCALCILANSLQVCGQNSKSRDEFLQMHVIIPIVTIISLLSLSESLTRYNIINTNSPTNSNTTKAINRTPKAFFARRRGPSVLKKLTWLVLVCIVFSMPFSAFLYSNAKLFIWNRNEQMNAGIMRINTSTYISLLLIVDALIKLRDSCHDELWWSSLVLWLLLYRFLHILRK